MKIVEWFKTNFLEDEKEDKKVDYKFVCQKLASEIMIRELAFNMVVNKISSALSKCKVNVYYYGKRAKDEEWYRWNVQPNINQSANQFWSKLIYYLYNYNEALVITRGNELYVADSYVKNEDYAFFEHTFTGVTINGYALNKTYRMSEVFYFELNNRNIRNYLNGTLQLYSELINAAYSSYLVANGNKGVLKIDQFAENSEDFTEQFNQLLNEDFKTFFSNANAVLPLYEGFEYSQLDNKGTQSTTRDFKALLDDVISMTANAFNVPSSIANGTVQDTSKAIDEFLTFCIDPLIEMLTDEMNRKSFSPYQIINGYYFKFNTLAIKHIDILDIANAIDKLLSSGFTCINDLRILIGLDPIDEEWANQFFMTKNYAPIEELLNALKGVMKHEKVLSIDISR